MHNQIYKLLDLEGGIIVNWWSMCSHYRQYDNGALCLLELSMDFNLVGHALRLVLEPSSAGFLGADMAEVDSSSVVLMFSTTLAAYRLVLPHPEVIAKVMHTLCPLLTA